MSLFLQTKLGDIRDREILELIEELEHVCPVGSQDFVNAPLLHFLTQCVYPQGPAKRIPISTKYVCLSPRLESRVGQLPDGAFRDLCGELAVLSQNALELFSGSKVCMLLNKTLPRFSLKGPSEKQKRWDAVIRQRRSNRG